MVCILLKAEGLNLEGNTGPHLNLQEVNAGLITGKTTFWLFKHHFFIE